MKRLLVFFAFLMASSCTSAQYSRYDDYGHYDDRYYYNDDFDWHWDIRVRISDGIRRGLITRLEANRLYNRLQQIEEKEYAYTRDGYFDGWEQDEIWRDIQWLNRRVGLELYDNDRMFYGFSRPGLAFRGYPWWFDRNGYDFYRFDRRGFGTMQRGYISRNYRPNRSLYADRNRPGNNRDYDWNRNGRMNGNDRWNDRDDRRREDNRWERDDNRRDNGRPSDNRTYGPRGSVQEPGHATDRYQRPSSQQPSREEILMPEPRRDVPPARTGEDTRTRGNNDTKGRESFPRGPQPNRLERQGRPVDSYHGTEPQRATNGIQ